MSDGDRRGGIAPGLHGPGSTRHAYRAPARPAGARLSDSYDYLVIGAGPAGMAAATTAARLGASTLLVDEQPAPGGQVYRGIERSDGSASAVFAEERLRGAALAAEFRASGAAYDPGTQVWQLERDC
ncbi:MAG: FAD-dependent oxidoreductase, partial [Betaproteobacteria bacterium]